MENVTKKKKKQDEFKMPEDRKLEEARQARLAVRKSIFLLHYFSISIDLVALLIFYG